MLHQASASYQVKLVAGSFCEKGDSDLSAPVPLWREYRELAAHDRAEAAPVLGYRAARHLLTLLEAGMEESEAVQVGLVHKFVMDPDMHEAAKLKASFDG